MRAQGTREELMTSLELLRKQRPLVHHVTNQVAAAMTADATLALGGTPVMARSPREAADAARGASAVVINMGTPSVDGVEAMLAAGQAARELAVPVIFDPVGVGFTPYRGEIAARVMETAAPVIICGNGAEIVNLAVGEAAMRGVEGLRVPEALLRRSGRKLALGTGAVVAATGETDWITDGVRELTVKGGHEWMGWITGTGCTATALAACFAAVMEDHLSAAVMGLACLSLAGRRAASGSRGPGSYRVALLDQLWRLREEMPTGEEWQDVVSPTAEDGDGDEG